MGDSVGLPTVPSRERMAGTIMIFLSTCCYGLSNTMIRLLTGYDVENDWILLFKEVIGLSFIFPWLLFRMTQGRLRLISKKQVLIVAIAAILCQLIGARLHVLSFAVLGLAVAVPLIQSSTLFGTAILGKFILGDPLSRRRVHAILILIVAVFLLGYGKGGTEQGVRDEGRETRCEEREVRDEGRGTRDEGRDLVIVLDSEAEPEVLVSVSAKSLSTGKLLLVILGTLIAGCAYSIYIVILRHVLRKYWNDRNSVWMSFQFTQWAGYDYPRHVDSTGKKNYAPFPVTLMMNIVLGVGVLVFGSCLYLRSGTAGFYNVPTAAWPMVMIAGLANGVGFFFQVHGLRMTSAVQASLIAVSQMVILSIIGVKFFGEPLNMFVVLGLLLTVMGVVLSAKPERE